MKTAKSNLLDRKIPTLVGLTILIGALMAGVFFLGDGLGVFAPRATPQTTPKQIKITNVTDNSFTVSFVTDEATTGFLKYGTKNNQMSTQVSDDRDQLAGNVGTYNTHHITVRSLQPQTTYYFTLGTASKAVFDNNGAPFSVKTGAKLSNLSLAQTIYGTVLTEASTPAEGSMVYVKIDDTSELSTLVRSSGTWAIPLSQARTADGNKQPEITATSPMVVFVQGKQVSSTAQLDTAVGQPQLPVETITLGEKIVVENNTDNTLDTSDTETTPSFTSTPSASIAPTTSPSPTAVASASPSSSPTTKPTTKPTATPSDEVTIPATDSAQPVSGSFENTLIVLVFGLSLVSFGSFMYLSLRRD